MEHDLVEKLRAIADALSEIAKPMARSPLRDELGEMSNHLHALARQVTRDLACS